MVHTLSRRELLRFVGIGGVAALAAACQPKIVEVEKVVTQVVKEVVKETVMVEGTPQVVEKEVTRVIEKVVTPTEAPREPVTLEFWVMQYMARSEGLWESLVAEFESLNPDVKLDWTRVTHADFEPKVLTGLASGTVGDILDVHPMHMATMAMRGALLPLDDLMPTLGVSNDEMTGAWEYSVWRGRRWAVPRSDNPTIILYNQRMVEEVGLPDPVDLWQNGEWDVDAFDTMMAAISRGEGADRVYGCTLLGGSSIRVQCVWLWGKDAAFWNAEGTRCISDSDAAIEAWEYMADSVRNGWAPTPAESNIPGGEIALLGQRRLATYLTGAQFVLGGQGQYIPKDVMGEMRLVPLNTLWNGKRSTKRYQCARNLQELKIRPRCLEMVPVYH